MPRTYKKKDIHTSPKMAGVQNLKGVELPKDEDNLMEKIMPVYKKGQENRGIYKGLWTDEALAEQIQAFFDYCRSVELKPTQPGLRLWLSVSRDTLWDWRTKPERYGVKCDLINQAFDIMENYLQANLDKYPTGSIFLLKTSHGHVEQSKLDITSNGKGLSATQTEVEDMVSKLGLDVE